MVSTAAGTDAAELVKSAFALSPACLSEPPSSQGAALMTRYPVAVERATTDFKRAVAALAPGAGGAGK